MKHYLMALLITLAPVASWAADEIEEKYFSAPNPNLTDQEQEGLNIVKEWKAANGKGLTEGSFHR